MPGVVLVDRWLQARVDISVCAVRWGLVREASISNYGDFAVERALCYRVCGRVALRTVSGVRIAFDIAAT